MPRMRADLLLVARGLAESRAKARAAIEAGGVLANGVVVAKPSDLIDEDAQLEVTPPHPWVSRGGVKLAAALDAFGRDGSADGTPRNWTWAGPRWYLAFNGSCGGGLAS